MRVVINTLLGGAFSMLLQPDVSVAQVKELIAIIQEIPVTQQSLVFRENPLRDAQTLGEAGVGDGDALTLVLSVSTAVTNAHLPSEVTPSYYDAATESDMLRLLDLDEDAYFNLLSSLADDNANLYFLHDNDAQAFAQMPPGGGSSAARGENVSDPGGWRHASQQLARRLDRLQENTRHRLRMAELRMRMNDKKRGRKKRACAQAGEAEASHTSCQHSPAAAGTKGAESVCNPQQQSQAKQQQREVQPCAGDEAGARAERVPASSAHASPGNVQKEEEGSDQSPARALSNTHDTRAGSSSKDAALQEPATTVLAAEERQQTTQPTAGSTALVAGEGASARPGGKETDDTYDAARHAPHRPVSQGQKNRAMSFTCSLAFSTPASNTSTAMPTRAGRKPRHTVSQQLSPRPTTNTAYACTDERMRGVRLSPPSSTQRPRSPDVPPHQRVVSRSWIDCVHLPAPSMTPSPVPMSFMHMQPSTASSCSASRAHTRSSMHRPLFADGPPMPPPQQPSSSSSSSSSSCLQTQPEQQTAGARKVARPLPCKTGACGEYTEGEAARLPHQPFAEEEEQQLEESEEREQVAVAHEMDQGTDSDQHHVLNNAKPSAAAAATAPADQTCHACGAVTHTMAGGVNTGSSSSSSSSSSGAERGPRDDAHPTRHAENGATTAAAAAAAAAAAKVAEEDDEANQVDGRMEEDTDDEDQGCKEEQVQQVQPCTSPRHHGECYHHDAPAMSAAASLACDDADDYDTAEHVGHVCPWAPAIIPPRVLAMPSAARVGRDRRGRAALTSADRRAPHHSNTGASPPLDMGLQRQCQQEVQSGHASSSPHPGENDVVLGGSSASATRRPSGSGHRRRFSSSNGETTVAGGTGKPRSGDRGSHAAAGGAPAHPPKRRPVPPTISDLVSMHQHQQQQHERHERHTKPQYGAARVFPPPRLLSPVHNGGDGRVGGDSRVGGSGRNASARQRDAPLSARRHPHRRLPHPPPLSPRYAPHTPVAEETGAGSPRGVHWHRRFNGFNGSNSGRGGRHSERPHHHRQHAHGYEGRHHSGRHRALPPINTGKEASNRPSAIPPHPPISPSRQHSRHRHRSLSSSSVQPPNAHSLSDAGPSCMRAHRHTQPPRTKDAAHARSASGTSGGNSTLAAAAASAHAKSPEDERARDASSTSTSASPKKRKGGKRCEWCKGKLRFAYQCRCEGQFCAKCRYSDKHNCTFDYQKKAKEELKSSLPACVSPRVPGI